MRYGKFEIACCLICGILSKITFGMLACSGVTDPSLQAFQSSSRTGAMQVELRADKVLLTSQAVIVLAGKLVAFE